MRSSARTPTAADLAGLLPGALTTRERVVLDPSGRDAGVMVLLYDVDPDVRMSYPDLVLDAGRAFVLETQKTIARTHEVDVAWIEALFETEARTRSQTAGLIAAGGAGDALRPAPELEGGWSFEARVGLPAEVVTNLTPWSTTNCTMLGSRTNA